MTEIPLIGYDVTALAAQMKEHQITAVITQSAASIPIVQLAAQSLSWRVPEDCSVIGFDNVLPAALSTPGLTTIHQPMRDMGGLATTLVLKMIESPGSSPTRRKLLQLMEPSLIQRDSTRLIKAKRSK